MRGGRHAGRFAIGQLKTEAQATLSVVPAGAAGSDLAGLLKARAGELQKLARLPEAQCDQRWMDKIAWAIADYRHLKRQVEIQSTRLVRGSRG